MTTIQEQIKLLQAVADGKTLQYQKKNSSDTQWFDASPTWHQNLIDGYGELSTVLYNWRIKPEPKVIWVNEYPSRFTPVIHFTESSAKQNADCNAVRVAVKYQEVL